MKPALTQDRLKELLHYDPETGAFTWARSTSNRAAPGTIAGSRSRGDYVRITIDRRRCLAHRLAFLYMTGEYPPGSVDHVNRDRQDNRWGNLRPASASENEANKGLRRDNSSGHRGVCWHKPLGKWVAGGRLAGRAIHLGVFSNLAEAAAAAKAWREKVFGAYATS